MADAIAPAEEKAIRDRLAKAEGVRIDSLAIAERKVTGLVRRRSQPRWQSDQ